MQTELASAVHETELRRPVRLVAGADMALSPDGEGCIGAVVLWDAEARVVVEQCVAVCELRFPYIPGLLSFREAPVLLAALGKLKHTPDVLMCDGHGLAHPRRFGIACHLGVIIGLPTIGCAKSRLVGEYEEPSSRRGSRSSLTHQGQTVGTVLRTRNKVKPVFVSIGHQIDLDSAERIVLDCAARYKLPEPTRLADRLAAEGKRRLR